MNIQHFARQDHTMPVYSHWLDAQISLVCLHGVGVAAQDTFAHLLPMLGSDFDVHFMDLRGAGDNKHMFGQYPSFAVDELVEDVLAFLHTLPDKPIVLMGYSFGGLVAMKLAKRFANIKQLILIESAGLERAGFSETKALATSYQQIAHAFKMEQHDQGLAQFIELVYPLGINDKVLPLMKERMLKRPKGLANALDAISFELLHFDREQLLTGLPNTHLLVGARSHDAMREYQQQLASEQGWQFTEVRGCDHTLPFQKPRQLAKLLNEISVS